MDSIRILAPGNNRQGQANARGKLFESVVGKVLQRRGYRVDEHRLNVSHSGMEIDIEGTSLTTGDPLYCECKCYSTDIDSTKIQTFFGKYMSRWFKNKRSQGLFVALPGLNSHARGFYEDNCLSNAEISIGLIQQPGVLSALIDVDVVVGADALRLDTSIGPATVGDRTLLCTDIGNFWMIHVVRAGSGIATHVQFFDSLGHAISHEETIQHLLEIYPEATVYEVLLPSAGPHGDEHVFESTDSVVCLQGSSSCFEYQFPAAPEYFVGRQKLLTDIDDFVSEVLNASTTCRGMLFEANSGWGKSSLVLAIAKALSGKGHFTVALDCRSASTPRFLLMAVEHVLDKFGDFDGLLDTRPLLGGIDAAADALIAVGESLSNAGKGLFIFLDQFENVFYLPEVLERIAQLCLRITDSHANVVLGFSWKTDLVGLTREFPYRRRDMIMDSCKVFRLSPFIDEEIDVFLDLLASEMKTTLRKDLRFLLSEYSQGYPWLLKKLCAHVKRLRQEGRSQKEIARGLLNVEELFLEDIEGLGAEEDEALHLIARLAPVRAGDLADELDHGLLQSLIDRRLIVKVGGKYDIYWDIFRDYLNTGALPVEEIYLLRSVLGSVAKVAWTLNRAGGSMPPEQLKERAKLSDGALLNILRDLRLLHLATESGGRIKLQLSPCADQETLLVQLRDHTQERLPRNRSVHRVIQKLRDTEGLTLNDLAQFLEQDFPYISAAQSTWMGYARNLATWLDFSDLVIFDKTDERIVLYETGKQLRDRSLLFARRRSGLVIPSVHFSPVVRVATRISSAMETREPVDWSGITRSTLYKSLSMLEQLGLIERRRQTIVVNQECHLFAKNPDKRLEIATKAVMKWPAFTKLIGILNRNRQVVLSHEALGEKLSEELGAVWKPATATTNVKVMLDWARHLSLAPAKYASTSRGRFRKAQATGDLPLFGSEQE